jgi:hypothetical protein
VRGGSTTEIRQGDTLHESHRHLTRTHITNPKTTLGTEQNLSLVRNTLVQKRSVSHPLRTEQVFNSKREVTQKRVSLLSVGSEQNITLLRKKDISTRLVLHTEQALSSRRQLTQKRVSVLSLNPEQSFTLVTSGTRRLREQLAALAARVEELENTQP